MAYIWTTPVTDRTAGDVSAGNSKGVLNATDLNRIEQNLAYIADVMTAHGYAGLTYSPVVSWAESGIPSLSHMQQILAACVTLRESFYYLGSLPATLQRPDYTAINQIENLPALIKEAMSRLEKSYIFSGTINSAGVALPQNA